MQGRAGRADRLGFQPQSLIQAAQRFRAKAAGQGGTRQAQQIAHAVQTQPGKARHRVGGQAQGRNRQGGQHLPHLARRGDDPLWHRRCRQRRRQAATFPPAPLCRARPGGAGFLHDVIAAAGRAYPLAREPRQRPGGPRRIGNPRPHRQAQIGTIQLHLRHQGGLAPEQMGAARQVDHQAVGRFFRHPGRELAGPAAQHGQKSRLGQRIGGAGQQIRAHGGGIAQGLIQPQPGSFRLGIKRDDHLRPVAVFGHGKGLGQRTTQSPQVTLCGKPWKPERKNSPLRHESSRFVHGMPILRAESSPVWPITFR